MSNNEKIRLALLRAVVELDYCHEKMGNDRKLTREDTLKFAQRVLATTKLGD